MKYKVLIIDDQTDIVREWVANDLADQNDMEFSILAKPDKISEYPDKVLASITKEQPDAVLLDIHLGDRSMTEQEVLNMTGQEVLKKIKSYYPYMPAIMLTGKQEESGVLVDRENNWQADDLFYKRKLTRDDGTLDQEQWNSLKAKLKAVVDYHGAPNNDDDKRLSDDLMEKVKSLCSSNKRSILSLQGEVGTGRRLFALALQKKLGLDKENSLTEVNCSCLSDALKSSNKWDSSTPDLEKLKSIFALSKGRVLFLRDVDKVDDKLKGDFIKAIGAIKEGKESPWIVAASTKGYPYRNLKQNESDQDNILSDFQGNIESIKFPSLTERLAQGEIFFKSLCENNIMARLILISEKYSQCRITTEALRLLILHIWVNNMYELEETLRLSMYKTEIPENDGISEGIKPSHIVYMRYKMPPICQHYEKTVTHSSIETRRADANKYKLSVDGEAVYELLARGFVKNWDLARRGGTEALIDDKKYIGLENAYEKIKGSMPSIKVPEDEMPITNILERVKWADQQLPHSQQQHVPEES